MTTLPPAVKTFTADNATGAEITPLTTCKEILIAEDGLVGTDDYTVTIGGYTITFAGGTEASFKSQPWANFAEGVGTGITIKRKTAGTLTFRQQERGR